MPPPLRSSSFFFFNDTATTEIYTLSLHDALPISRASALRQVVGPARSTKRARELLSPELASTKAGASDRARGIRSEEHTSELQSRQYLVCRLLLEKKKKRHTDG